MRLGLYLAVLDDLEVGSALDLVLEAGITSIEISSHTSARFDVEDMLAGDGVAQLLRLVNERDISVNAINMSADGQLLLGPYHSDTAWIHDGSPRERSAFAARRLVKAAELANALEVPTVTGFVGCEDYSRWFPWPDANAWEATESTFVEAITPVLDQFRERGVCFAMEPHPRQFVYNTETAVRSVELLEEHPAWRFNFDPANLTLAGVDPVTFVSELGRYIVNVHAKDAELVQHHAARSGLLANGPWDRPDRGFRFRVAGWGDIQWKKVITELSLNDYTGPLTIEHEDPTMGPLDGVRKAAHHLEPLLMGSR